MPHFHFSHSVDVNVSADLQLHCYNLLYVLLEEMRGCHLQD